jgi:dihydroxyacid dehydratase/phosphogluconate dehydratase
MLGVVQDYDLITCDVTARVLRLEVSDEVIARRITECHVRRKVMMMLYFANRDRPVVAIENYMREVPIRPRVEQTSIL